MSAASLAVPSALTGYEATQYVQILSLEASFLTGAVRVAGFLTYVVAALTATLLLVFAVAPVHGTSNVFVYIAICSIVGSLSVVSCKVQSQLPGGISSPFGNPTPAL